MLAFDSFFLRSGRIGRRGGVLDRSARLSRPRDLVPPLQQVGPQARVAPRIVPVALRFLVASDIRVVFKPDQNRTNAVFVLDPLPVPPAGAALVVSTPFASSELVHSR